MTIADAAALAPRLRDALVELRPDNPYAVDTLRDLYAMDMVFRDPIQEINGLEDFIRMNRRLLGRLSELTWTIEAIAEETLVMIEWRMSGRAKLGPRFDVEGVTRARVLHGRIQHHRDYWDLGELAVSAVPGGKRILHALLKPFA